MDIEEEIAERMYWQEFASKGGFTVVLIWGNKRYSHIGQMELPFEFDENGRIKE